MIQKLFISIGAVAALAVASGKPPHEIPWTDAEAALRKAGLRGDAAAAPKG